MRTIDDWIEKCGLSDDSGWEKLSTPSVNQRKLAALRTSGIIGKQHIVVLNFLNEVLDRESKCLEYTEQKQRADAAQRWRKRTDDLLESCSLPVLYPPCRIDSLFIAALSDEDPITFVHGCIDSI